MRNLLRTVAFVEPVYRNGQWWPLVTFTDGTKQYGHAHPDYEGAAREARGLYAAASPRCYPTLRSCA